GIVEPRGSFGADPLGVFATRGVEPRWDELGGLAELAGTSAALRALRASSAPSHDAGATAPQEIAAILSIALAYLRRLVDSGLGVEEAARRIEIELPIGADVFWEIAKLRAMRWIWGRVLGASGAKAAPRIEASTSWRMMSARDPWVNLLRTTSAA